MTNHPARVALVTGANQGIGLQVARELAARELTVLVGSRDLDRGVEAAGGIQGDARALQLDITDAESVLAAERHIFSELGRLDVLVNNAGVSFLGEPETPLMQRAQAGLLTTIGLDEVRRFFEINVFGAIAVTQAMLPLLQQAPEGRIVNVGSSGSSMALNADPGNPVRALFGIYPVSKSALHAVTLAFANALEATGTIKVNVADPGFTATALNNYEGTRTVQQGAGRIVELALLGPDGPTGTFSGDEGPIPW